MQYFFQLGGQYDLCYAELTTCLEANFSCKFKIYRPLENIVIIEPDGDKDLTAELKQLFLFLGGAVRFGVMIDDSEDFLDKFSGRITFGVNSFGVLADLKAVDKFAKKIKERYSDAGFSARFLLPKSENYKEITLNSAQVSKNKLIEKGFELNLIKCEDDVRMGQTLAVQDYEQFSIIDFEKPRSDKKMGMLPPKLARIMVNLSGTPFNAEKIIWDPFCGSGGILMQALLTSRSAIGSDIDKWAVRNSEQNIDWMISTHPDFADFSNVRYKLFDLDITDIPKPLFKAMKNTPLDAVICEPFMGPPQRRVMSRRKAFSLIKDVQKQYRALFDFLTIVGQDGLTAVIVVPAYKTEYGWQSFYVNELIRKKNWKIIKKGLHWERKTSIIRRDIIVLRLNK